MRVLLVKLSSMGDVIHALPALTDAQQAIPELKFTWLIENGFQEIAHWHPAVEQVIPIALRKRQTRQVLAAIKQMRSQRFDVAIDAQGLIKSALLLKLARAKYTAGYDRTSIREAVASYLYNRKCEASWELHAVERMRRLFAQALGYALPTSGINYGIAWDNITQTYTQSSSQPYVVFLHGTTWDSKHWPDQYWRQLADLLAANNLAVQVTWATPQQKARAAMLAQSCPNVTMLPHLTINAAARVLHNACGVVTVDTGFGHLSAALHKPLVAIFGSTPIKENGMQGSMSVNLDSRFGCAPCARRVCSYSGASAVQPACMQEITPQLVWQNLSKLLVNIL